MKGFERVAMPRGHAPADGRGFELWIVGSRALAVFKSAGFRPVLPQRPPNPHQASSEMRFCSR